jgi:hypothetical protein
MAGDVTMKTKQIALNPEMYAEAMKLELGRTGIRFVEYVLEDGVYEVVPERVYKVGDVLYTRDEVLSAPRNAAYEAENPDGSDEPVTVQLYARRNVWTVSGQQEREEIEDLLPVRITWLP